MTKDDDAAPTDSFEAAALVAAGIGTFRVDVGAGVVEVSESLRRLVGWPNGTRRVDLATFAALATDGEREALAAALGDDRDVDATFHVAARRFAIALRTVPGERARLGTMRDATAASELDAAHRTAVERLRFVQSIGRIGDWEYDLVTSAIRWSEEVFAMFERDPALGAPDYATAIAYYTDDDRTRLEAAIEFAVTHGERIDQDFTIRLPGGRIAHHFSAIIPVRGDDGRVVRLIGTVQDITARKRLEAAVLHTQKLEGIGRLAGGIAHDFNNCLLAILGNAELAEMDLEPDHPVRVGLAQIRAASMRARDLTAQLLAFSRRQQIRPRRVDPNALLTRLRPALQRTLGDAIRLTLDPAGDVWPILVDPSQLERLLVELAMNARDAMPTGGVCAITTDAVTLRDGDPVTCSGLAPGDYVRFVVADTGIGVAPSAMAHLFEPFFTTKGVGKGSGLGLSTCYGIVHQAGGRIDAYSDPGRETRFVVHLPRAPADAPVDPDDADEGSIRGGVERILLVEDEPVVRSMTQRMLEQLGYRVIVAADGVAACDVLQTAPDDLALVVTDIVMPEMSGLELAAHVRSVRPNCAILFVSGYAEALVGQGEVAVGHVDPIAKPFTRATLAARVRAALDARANA